MLFFDCRMLKILDSERSPTFAGFQCDGHSYGHNPDLPGAYDLPMSLSFPQGCPLPTFAAPWSKPEGPS
jgi:hypothetical protein